MTDCFFRRTVIVPALVGLWFVVLLALLPVSAAATLQITQTDKLTADDALAGDRFGATVALSGDLLAVGAPGVEGAGPAAGSVYIYQRNLGGAELWAKQAELNIPELRAGDSFGAAVALYNDLLAVGAPGDDSHGNNSGAVYLFSRVDKDAQQWTLLLKLVAPDARSGQQFGQVLALEHNLLMVSAPFADEARGSIYGFTPEENNLASWQVDARLRGETVGERFGSGLALHSGLLAIGAPLAGNGQTITGRINLYQRDSTSLEGWRILTTLRGDRSDSGFGSALGLSSHWLVAGVPLTDDSRGGVYVFHGHPGTAEWPIVANLSAPSPGDGQHFGERLAISSDTLVVGASQNDDGGSNAGIVYVFDRDARSTSSWSLNTGFRADDSVTGDQFGGVIAFDGATIAVGVPNDSDVGVESGAAYTFVRGGSRWEQTDKLIAEPTRANDQFGFSVALGGETLVVGAHFDSEQGVDAGSAYVFERGINQGKNWVQHTKLLAAGTNGFDRFGQAVDISGDTLAIGALGDDHLGADTGAVFVFQQNWYHPTGWQDGKRINAIDADPGDSFGNALALYHDILLVGAFADDGAGGSAGAAYLYRHQPGGEPAWQALLKLLPDDAKATHQFGISVALLDDIAVVGAHFDDHAGLFSGSAYVFQRDPERSDDWQQIAKLTADDATGNDQFGYSVAISRNMIAVGAPGKAGRGPGAGAVYLFGRGRRSGEWIQRHKIQARDGRSEDQFGFSIDLDDRWLVVGARRHDAAGEDAGAVYVFGRNQGGTELWGEFDKLTASDARPGIRFGEAVSVDRNTLAVGAPFDSHSGVRSGAVYIFRLGR